MPLGSDLQARRHRPYETFLENASEEVAELRFNHFETRRRERLSTVKNEHEHMTLHEQPPRSPDEELRFLGERALI
ncbi:hypothetical protein T484DRAFT_1815219 [Baffinella frigidus]|nr:hypothetical protein T484DRAFT_1815219 [Cryptophyta sp. CCMP2293]